MRLRWYLSLCVFSFRSLIKSSLEVVVVGLSVISFVRCFVFLFSLVSKKSVFRFLFLLYSTTGIGTNNDSTISQFVDYSIWFPEQQYNVITSFEMRNKLSAAADSPDDIPENVRGKRRRGDCFSSAKENFFSFAKRLLNYAFWWP